MPFGVAEHYIVRHQHLISEELKLSINANYLLWSRIRSLGLSRAELALCFFKLFFSEGLSEMLLIWPSLTNLP